MQEILINIAQGFSVAGTATNLLWAFLGTVLGTMVGVLPGLGPVSAMAILLPITYAINDPVASIIFMAGLYYGTQYGGSTTSILLNLPGESSSVVTTLDGYKMTYNGRGGAALTIAALASFFAGTVATMIIALLGIPVSKIAFLFGPAEYTALMILALVAAAGLGNSDFLKSLGMVLVGILIGLIGTDINSGIMRFTAGVPDLADGITFAIIGMGVFGLGELLYNLLHITESRPHQPTLKDLYPTREELAISVPATIRGTTVGSILGLLPGGGAIISSFAAYVIEKKLSRDSKNFGNGSPAGVASPEAANNAGAQTSFIPMLSLGLPTTPVMAMMIAVLMANNIQPGPMVLTTNSAMFWGLIASMWIGNCMLLILNLPLVGVWISLLKIKRAILYPLVCAICVIGALYINNNWFDVWLLAPFAILGYVFRALDCEPAPLAMGFVVGVLFEENLRRALTISQGNYGVFFNSTISCVLLAVSLAFVVFGLYRRNTRF